MSTKFDLQQALTLAMKAHVISPAESAKMLQWSQVDPEALTGRPDLLQQALYWQDQTQRLVASPLIQNAMHTAPAPAAPARHHSAQVMQANLNDATGNHTLMGLPQQRSINPGQQAQTYRGGVTVYYDATPMAQRSAALPAQEIQAIKSELNRIEQAFKEFERKGVAILRAQAKKAKPVQKAQVQAQQPTPPPQLPISPITNAPSQIRAASMGLPSAWLPQYQVEQQVNQGQAQKGNLPISPITGQPSELTAQMRRSVGIIE